MVEHLANLYQIDRKRNLTEKIVQKQIPKTEKENLHQKKKKKMKHIKLDLENQNLERKSFERQ